jgi:amino acid transporter
MLSTAFVVIFGCIYLGSSSALNAILSSSVVLLNCSYIMPIAILIFGGRERLQYGPFRLGIWGPIANWIGLIFGVFTTVFFLFPPVQPVTGNDMNYACGALLFSPRYRKHAAYMHPIHQSSSQSSLFWPSSLGSAMLVPNIAPLSRQKTWRLLLVALVES